MTICIYLYQATSIYIGSVVSTLKMYDFHVMIVLVSSLFTTDAMYGAEYAYSYEAPGNLLRLFYLSRLEIFVSFDYLEFIFGLVRS